jgi:hypothetical protein
MTELFFPYKHVYSEIFGEILIPVAKIFLSAKKEIGLDVIVDSGAVISIFPKSICELIGLNYEEGKEARVKTVTGEDFTIRIHKVEVRIGVFSLVARVGFSEIENVPYVLGRLDVFDKVGIEFERYGTKFIIGN